MSKFSSIRSGVTDFGKTTLPSWMCQRSTTCPASCRGPGDLGDRRVVEHRALGQRAPGLGHDAEVRVLAAQPLLLEARVQLDLVDRRRDARLVDDPLAGGRRWKFETPIERTRPSCCRLDERLPGLHVEVLAGTGQWIR